MGGPTDQGMQRYGLRVVRMLAGLFRHQPHSVGRLHPRPQRLALRVLRLPHKPSLARLWRKTRLGIPQETSLDGSSSSATEPGLGIQVSATPPPPKYQVVQTIYSMQPFRELQDAVSGYMAKYGFYVEDDDRSSLRRYPLMHRWMAWQRQNVVTGAVVYAVPSHYDMIGSGALVRVFNHRSSKHEGAAVPEVVLRTFPGTPNAISVEVHQRWGWFGNTLALDLATHIARSGRHNLLLSLDDELTAVKSNPHLSDEQKALAVSDLGDGYFPQESQFPVLKSALESRLGGTWLKLHPDARRFLIAGYVAYDRLDGASSQVLEASPPVVALSKALERTLWDCVLLPFRRYLVEIGQTRATLASQDKRLKGLLRAATDHDARPLELGTLAVQLWECPSCFIPPGRRSRLPSRASARLGCSPTSSSMTWVPHFST